MAERLPNRFAEAIRLVTDVARRSGFRVALIGGFALPFYGVQRATGDVDFLVGEAGGDPLHASLLERGMKCLHRTADVANYDPGTSGLCGIDLVYARRPRSREMLERARPQRLRSLRRAIAVVDAEGLIGLKLQAIANEPSRRAQDEADIRALLSARGDRLDAERLRDYYRLFEREAEIEEWIHDSRKR